MPEDKRPSVSIIIKAFNEERHIAAAIESALAALGGIDGEVILADGASTDRTVAIATKYPIKIVRLDRASDRSCGAGSQLGYQYSRGEFICLMDGDMRLHAAFLAAGTRFLKEHPGVAGVGGTTINHDAVNLEYAQRVRRYDPDRQPGVVTRLGGCGLYRRAAVEATGYLTDRNLHGGEEFELAARLRAIGWTLARIDRVAVDHYCRPGNSYGQLLQRVQSHNTFAPGEVARAAMGRPHFGYVLRQDKHLMLCGLIALWWCSIAAVAILAIGSVAALSVVALALFPFAVMSYRWRSLRYGIYSVTVWNVHALCFVPGMLWPRATPRDWIASTIVTDMPAAESYARVARG
jgi:glycosyltransferase involved in cell wall biosynthesis